MSTIRLFFFQENHINNKIIAFSIEVFFLFLSLCVNESFLYLLFFCLIVSKLKNISKEFFLESSIYSIILPDNYSSFFLFTAFFLALITSNNLLLKLKFNITNNLLLSFLFLALLSSFVNQVSLLNLSISLITYFPFLLFVLFIGNKDNYLNNFLISKCYLALKRVVRIEIIATLINFIMLLLSFKNGDDWSTGTFGSRQQAQLFLFFLFVTILFYFDSFPYSCKLKKYVYCISCFLCIVSTNCWTLLIVTFSFIVFSFFIQSIKVVLNVFFFILVGGGIAFFSSYNNTLQWSVLSQLKQIATDQDYRDYRAPKINTYIDTFISIPGNDKTFLFIGNGWGWYSSRSALVCTGKYLDLYNSYFSESMSNYTVEYIYPGVEKSYYYPYSDSGSVIARPYSSIISLMGETGIIGLSLFLFIVFFISKELDIKTRPLFFAWIGSCFCENYVEYVKVILTLFICVLIINYSFRQRFYQIGSLSKSGNFNK